MIILFTVLLMLVFGKLMGIALRTAWAVFKFIGVLVVLPLALIALVLVGLVKLALPVLIVIGIVVLIKTLVERSRSSQLG